MTRTRAMLVALLVILAASCQVQRNYTTAEGPRYTGFPPPHIEPPRYSDTLRIVSFNIEYALRIDSALAVLRSEPELRGADILLLQEMDAPATRHIARALGMWFVYYPATLHLRHKRDFGNAVLSRWPIVEDEKIMLPHTARLVRTARTATAATVRVGDVDVRVYSAHLGTYVNITPTQRREQLQTILDNARPYSRVVLGGDMNDPSVGELVRSHGYAWPTEEGPRTAAVGRLDHIFLKGLFTPDSAGSGTVLNVRESSDHRPIWALALLRTK
jgi:endonuclease/exonuclease/phosphatase family metal-dependent hydrolase